MVHYCDLPNIEDAWVAVGDYMGKRVEVVGSSATNAAKRWVAAARCKGTGSSERAASHRTNRKLRSKDWAILLLTQTVTEVTGNRRCQRASDEQ